jgi:hypothetical protein
LRELSRDKPQEECGKEGDEVFHFCSVSFFSLWNLSERILPTANDTAIKPAIQTNPSITMRIPVLSIVVNLPFAKNDMQKPDANPANDAEEYERQNDKEKSLMWLHPYPFQKGAGWLLDPSLLSAEAGRKASGLKPQAG